MRMKDTENIVPIEGHRGPHPQDYHELVYESLNRALRNCRTIADCRVRLLVALDDLAQSIATPGSDLNRLVTQGK
jgi:hypothetical protein